MTDKMKSDVESVAASYYEKSEIRQFFAEKTVLLTGATGYMGKLTVEKLLRSCPEVKKIFVLIRPKKGLTVLEILKKTYSNIVFDLLRKQSPNFEEKIVLIPGDLEKSDLGLSVEDQRMIEREVNIIFHTGATTKFDEKISVALQINVLATKKLLEIAKNCENLEIFMYMSTAYSHCHQQHIEEKFYRSPADMKMVEDIIRADTENKEGITAEAMEVLRGGWPNNYVFTKAIAEDMVRQCGETAKFACGVYRPSVVLSTHNEPLVGWCGNINGPMAAMIGTAMGIVHCVPFEGHPMDIAPADMCTNAYIASTWYTIEQQKQQNEQETSKKEAAMFNFGSSVVKPIRLDTFFKGCYDVGYKYPPSSLVWLPFVVFCTNFWQFVILHYLYHGIPAVLGDIVLYIYKRQTPKLTPFFWKFNRHLGKINYYMNGNWKIHVEKTLKMCDRMNSVDKDLFYCDFRNFDWNEYIPHFVIGMRTIYMKDPIETSKRTNKTKYIFITAHYGACALLVYLSVIMAKKLLCSCVC